MARRGKATKRRWTREEARAVLARWRRSGQPLPTWCAAEGLGYERVRRWRKALAGEREARPGGVEPIALREIELRPTALSAGEVVLELAAGERLTLRGPFEPARVAALVRALARP
jgi:hypothetical protein